MSLHWGRMKHWNTSLSSPQHLAFTYHIRFSSPTLFSHLLLCFYHFLFHLPTCVTGINSLVDFLIRSEDYTPYIYVIPVISVNAKKRPRAFPHKLIIKFPFCNRTRSSLRYTSFSCFWKLIWKHLRKFMVVNFSLFSHCYVCCFLCGCSHLRKSLKFILKFPEHKL